ncbi:MAG: ABC transporter ATP-binding protein, partial [Candidatus Korarchaeota archaeon]|nr:ABC transporter ATP-binding protein [Candidatus Korarchaeota archaeon]NIU85175.1 ATP-binding cassette domain-containing protein [Candidatus Thorarchaeota archaeon]NIW15264.1 ATP-binding cassette domain-containing protein [Candidatus Thorarchaeota archaeon]NIW53236.1 ATP-binding cassette domain-containing protein [Candidatus Korarchaeota archaeon]
MSTLLRVKDLRTWFRTERGFVKALNGVNFSMNEGESFGLVGETGCGKSVTARTILRILDENGFIKSGSIEFRGQNLLELSDKEMTNKIRGKEIGMIFQDPRGSLDPVYT